MTDPYQEEEPLPPMDIEGPSDDMRQAIRLAVMAEMDPVEAPSIVKRSVLILVAAAAVAALVIVSYGAMGLEGFAKNAVAVIACTVVAGAVALFIGGSFTERGQELLGRTNRSVLVVTLIVAWSVYLFSNMTDQALGTAFAGPAVGCAVRSLVAGVLGCAAFMWIWRKTDPWTPRISGALLGACAGAIASAGVGIPCAAEVGGHLLVGHWLVVPILAVAAALVAPRVLQP